MKTTKAVTGNRHCSRELCIDCLVQNGCLHMSHVFDVPDTWDLQQADNLLFKRRIKNLTEETLQAANAIHGMYSTVHS